MEQGDWDRYIEDLHLAKLANKGSRYAGKGFPKTQEQKKKEEIRLRKQQGEKAEEAARRQ
jgi:hypothetical protein